MTKELNRRLTRLTGAAPEARLHVVEGTTEAEVDKAIAALIRAGNATPNDLFIRTGVTRSIAKGLWGQEDYA